MCTCISQLFCTRLEGGSFLQRAIHNVCFAPLHYLIDCIKPDALVTYHLTQEIRLIATVPSKVQWTALRIALLIFATIAVIPMTLLGIALKMFCWCEAPINISLIFTEPKDPVPVTGSEDLSEEEARDYVEDPQLFGDNNHSELNPLSPLNYPSVDTPDPKNRTKSGRIIRTSTSLPDVCHSNYQGPPNTPEPSTPNRKRLYVEYNSPSPADDITSPSMFVNGLEKSETSL
jgi:hypothetical protein